MDFNVAQRAREWEKIGSDEKQKALEIVVRCLVGAFVAQSNVKFFAGKRVQNSARNDEARVK
jgi:hypothetical protein